MEKELAFRKSLYQEVDSDSPRFKLIKNKFNQLLGQKQEKENRLKTVESIKKDLQYRLICSEKAQEIIKQAAFETQQKLELHISNLVSLAEASVFDSPYEFLVRFRQMKSKTECELIFIKDDKEYGDTLFAAGGGPNDVASFALRCAFWGLKRNRSILILDEPFNFVNDEPKNQQRDLEKKCADMVRMIVNKLGLQVIIVTTLPEFLAIADNVIDIQLNGKISEVNKL